MCYQVHFFRVKYHPFFAAILRSLWGCSFNGLNILKSMCPPKNYWLELNENSFPNIVWSLVLIDSILSLTRSFQIFANLWKFKNSWNLKTWFLKIVYQRVLWAKYEQCTKMVVDGRFSILTAAILKTMVLLLFVALRDFVRGDAKELRCRCFSNSPRLLEILSWINIL